MLLGAGALAHPLVAVAVLLGATGVTALVRPTAKARPVAAGVLALAVAAPGLWPLARALSLREAASIVIEIRPGSLALPVLGLFVAAVAPLACLRLVASRAPGRRLAAAGLALLGGLLFVARVHAWMASGQMPPPTREALARVAASTSPLAAVCAPEAARDWVPALAGRAAGEPGPWVPAVYADEWARRARRPCSARLEEFVRDR